MRFDLLRALLGIGQERDRVCATCTEYQSARLMDFPDSVNGISDSCAACEIRLPC
jgi:hypothetical protein